MSTVSLDELQNLLGNLGLSDRVPEFPHTDITRSPLEIFHCYLADIIVRLTGCEAEVAYQAVLRSNDVSHGDLAVVVPKLRLKDVVPTDYVLNLMQRVMNTLCAAVLI